MALPDLKIINGQAVNKIIKNYIIQLASKGEIRILEAGCGRRWGIDLQDIPYSLTGVDMDKDALHFRKNQQKDLHHAVLGDLRYVDFPPNSYDVIYCKYVLEHVQGAELALKNFLKWLKPGGLLIIMIPDRDSVYGFFARLTPHWFHVFFYRYVFGYRDAGTPGHCPYPTFYDKIISRRSFLEFARDNQLYVKEESGIVNFKKSSLLGLFIEFIHFVSLGRLHSSHVNLLYILVYLRSENNGD